MVPIILISDNPRKTTSFLKNFIRLNKISDRFIFEIKPLSKEFSIDQIREIKKNLIYSFSDLHLYILYDFDKASFEAQNAFLKTLEEHQETIQFIMLVKNAHKLTDTVLSRSKIINLILADTAANKDLHQLLERFLISDNLKVLVDERLQTKQRNNPTEIFTDLMIFFRQRLVKDPKSAKALKKILSTKYLVENNNLDPQTGIDSILLYINRIYQTR